MDVLVALIAHPTDPFRKTAPQDEWNRPYAERRKVRLEASEDESLAAVLDRAAEALGLSSSGGQYGPRFAAGYRSVAFYKPEDEDGFASRHVARYLMSELTLVDDRGRAIFGVRDMRVVRYRDLLRAEEVGTLDGDPLRPYLIVEPGYGDVPPPDWPTVIEGLEVVWDVLERLAIAGGAWAFGKAVFDEVRRRLGRGVEAGKTHPEWAQRATRPYEFAVLFFTRPWRTAELAGLLGCTENEAEGILWALGFSVQEDGRWHHGGDEASELINAVQREIQIASHRGGVEWTAVLRQRLIYLLESGEAPPLNFESDSGEEDDVGWQATAGERIGWAIDRAIGRLRGR